MPPTAVASSLLPKPIKPCVPTNPPRRVVSETVGPEAKGIIAPGPGGPVGPVAPVGPIGPVGPVGPMAPVGPAGPVAPVAPVAPVGPGGPVVPVAPVGPVGPAALWTYGPVGLWHQEVRGPVGPGGPGGLWSTVRAFNPCATFGFYSLCTSKQRCSNFLKFL